MAAACFQKELAGREMQEGWSVSSAGTWAADGLPATPDAISFATRLDLDLRDHSSRVITPGLILATDLVIVMERGQKEALQGEFSEARGKVQLLSELAEGVEYDIPDPAVTASPGEVYKEISDLVAKAFDRIRRAVDG